MAEQPKLECDLIMRGGITSGVVYPMAVVTLAENYRFRSIGGTSAGAIAAAVTAAASYGRRQGHDGFAEVEKLPKQLGEVTPTGRTTLMSLFKADSGAAPLLDFGLAAIGRSSYFGKLLALWSAFPIGSALGALAGLLPTLLLFLAAPGSGLAWIALILALGLALVGSVIGGGFAALLLARREIPKNSYGLCSGKGETDRSGVPALTNWLHALIQQVAGRGGDPTAPPLTFGDLWGTKDEAAERDIELVLMTTNITQGIAHRFPFLDGPSGPFFFSETEFKRLFPESIVRWLVENARSAGDDSHIHCPNGFYCLPKAADLPVLVGARLSLSFPFLLSAVPLYAGNRNRRNAEGKWRLERCWFSDGGLTSNFPIHFFDSTLPTRPTFGINLVPSTATDLAGMKEGSPNPLDMVMMPNRNSDGQNAIFNDIESNPAKLTNFFGALFDTARNWADSELMRMPGYRDRIVHIGLYSHEGGMNLDMPPEVIEDLGKRGRAAGDLLKARYAHDPGLDPKTGEPITLTWDNHRWVRYRTTMAALEDLARGFRANWERSRDPGSPWESYEDLIKREVDAAPSYKWATKTQRQHAIDITEAFTTFVDSWRTKDQTFDRTDRKDHKGRSPRPKSSLRIMPPGDSDPRG